ncbi:MAG: type II toxin-antitoxin system RelE/ParE family toxin [Acidobacteriota bacterium]
MSSGSIEIRWEKRALKELRSLPKKDRERVFVAVDGLRSDPMAGRPLAAEWKGLRRLRVGSYRVIYAFDGSALKIAVVRLGHRRYVYR